MDIDKLQKVYFIGIGGIGMSAIARFFKSIGKDVSGYDRTSTDLTKNLINEGMDIHFFDDVNLIPENFKEINEIDRNLIVYTPAIQDNHKELNYFKKNGFVLLKRSEVLGLISNKQKGIAVAGTHGKTTVSTIIAHLLKQSDKDCSAFLGGISKNYNSNLLLSEKSNYVVVEADEFDRSFLKLYPYLEVITSVDADHLDIYKNKEQLKHSYKQFIKQIKPNGKLIIKKGIDLNLNDDKKIKRFTYSLDSEADFFAKNITLENGKYWFDIVTPTTVIKNLSLGLTGLMNVENAVAAVAVAYMVGVGEESLRLSLKSFLGVKRRFDFIIKKDDLTYIDDYAHHPEEIKACINSVKKLFPGRKITGVFQPHLYSRTRYFADEFAKSLDLLDELILLEIYPARESPIKGINSKLILDKVSLKEKTLCPFYKLIEKFKEKELEILLTLGAGDIDKLVEPIKKQLLINKEK